VDLSYNSIPLFPTIIHQFDVNGFDEIQNQLIDYVYQFKDKNFTLYGDDGRFTLPNDFINLVKNTKDYKGLAIRKKFAVFWPLDSASTD